MRMMASPYLAGILASALAVTVFLPGTDAAEQRAGDPRRPLLLMLSQFDNPQKDLAAMTLGWMCKAAGCEFDVYYAADHGTGGLFAGHGSTVIGGHHAARVARALAVFETTVVRLGDASIFESLIRPGGTKVIDCRAGLIGLYESVRRELLGRPPAAALAFQLGALRDARISPAYFWPECVYRRAWALPLALDAQQLKRLRAAGVKTVWTVARRDADVSAWTRAGFEVKSAVDLSAAGPVETVVAVVERWADKAAGVDMSKPTAASYMLPFSMREDRLILLYRNNEEAYAARDRILRLSAGKTQTVIYGQWFGDPPLIPLARLPMAFQVTEPCRPFLTVFSRHPVPLPQSARSCFELEPSDEQLAAWAREGKILATWVLHSGELPHDDALLSFLDWSAMTKVKIGSGVHWQRYYVSPHIMELLHVPVDQGGVLGLVEPVLHSAGSGIMWEAAGDARRIAGLMKRSREKIASVAGERFAPRGVYCFADHARPRDHTTLGDRQLQLWKAIQSAGFEYVISSVQPGDSRILYRDGDFVVLNQAGRPVGASPLVRGDPTTFAAVEKKLAAAGKPGWLVGAIDSIIHGCPIYIGRRFENAPRINEFYDYVQKGGVTGNLISATPHTVARYARLLDR